MKKTVVLALSGGVDSACSLYLLLKRGFHVIPVFMRNWDTYLNQENNLKNDKYFQENEVCSQEKDYADAKKIANFFHCDLKRIDFVDKYWEKVFLPFLEKYRRGLVPNPDIYCNFYIKFDEFIKYASSLKADYIAFGHYARLIHKRDGIHMYIPKDKKKDQTYFLSFLRQEQLKNIIFPLEKTTKKKVYQIIKKLGLNFLLTKKTSTGICFVGKRKFHNFLANYLPLTPGKIIDYETGKVIGKHIGAYYYTIGQNKMLNLSGMKEKYYVFSKDVKNNLLYVAKKDSIYHFSYQCKVLSYHFFLLKNQEKYQNRWIKARFRYQQRFFKVKYFFQDKAMFVNFKNPLSLVTEGQFVVFYYWNECLGGGEIEKCYKIKPINERI